MSAFILKYPERPTGVAQAGSPSPSVHNAVL